MSMNGANDNGLLDLYMKDIKDIPLLNKAEERVLSDIVNKSENKTEVAAAVNHLVKSNLRLVVKFAIKYHNRIKGHSDFNVSIMDLISEGNMGLHRAAELFDAENHDNKFSTYAVLSINRRIDRFIKGSRFIRLPINHYTLFRKYAELKKELGPNVDDETMMKEMGVTKGMFRVIKREHAEHKLVISSEDTDIQEVIQNIADEHHVDSDLMASQDLKEYLYGKIKELPERDQDVIFFRYFSNKEVTLKDIADKYGVTRQAIDQRLPKAMRKLRNSVLKDFKSDGIYTKG